MKRRILPPLMLIIGLLLLAYPTVSNYWNARHATAAITTYTESLADINEAMYEEMWAAADDFNSELATRANLLSLNDDQQARYRALLNVAQSGQMGYIEIPAINVSLPIYHGTDEAVLQVAVGHLEWSSLPTGGEDTHTVLSGHRGLPSAQLFTHLDRLTAGDTFTLHVLNRALTYEVDQILIVEPNDTTELQIIDGQSLCTLVTCTPYGINTQRLLVRGHRTEGPTTDMRITGEAIQIDQMLVATTLAVPALLAICLIAVVRRKQTANIKNNEGDDYEES